MSTKALPASIISRVKAFIIDIFLIAVPLLYITTYAVLDGKDDFQHNQLAIFAVWAIFGIIQALFFSLAKAQSPGYRAQGIYLVNLEGKKPSFVIYILRYFFFITTSIFGGSFFVFFRADRRALHDLLARTIVVEKNQI